MYSNCDVHHHNRLGPPAAAKFCIAWGILFLMIGMWQGFKNGVSDVTGIRALRNTDTVFFDKGG
jgi:hypothetical protein